jgi:hypothetical protein
MVPRPFNARTRVHEYGGGDFLVHKGSIYFSDFKSQVLHRVPCSPGAPRPEALTAALPGRRFAELHVCPPTEDSDNIRLVAVCENHEAKEGSPVNSIVVLEVGSAGAKLVGEVTGFDFCASPCVSQCGTTLAFIAWDHPNMPWHATRLYTVGCSAGVQYFAFLSLPSIRWQHDFVHSQAKIRADGSVEKAAPQESPQSESVMQPRWGRDGSLYFISDRTNWWNLYRTAAAGGEAQPLLPRCAEVGGPLWRLGAADYAFVDDHTIACSFMENGVSHLGLVSLGAKPKFTELPLPPGCVEVKGVQALSPDELVLLAGGPSTPQTVIL